MQPGCELDASGGKGGLDLRGLRGGDAGLFVSLRLPNISNVDLSHIRKLDRFPIQKKPSLADLTAGDRGALINCGTNAIEGEKCSHEDGQDAKAAWMIS